MNKKLLIIVGFITLAAVAGALWIFRAETKGRTNVAEAKAVYYCPMHKEYVSDKPGNCPICSMKLVKREGKHQEEMKQMTEHSNMEQMQSEQQTTESGTVFIPPERRQTLGVRSASAEVKLLSREIRTVGKIAYDETRITHIHTKFNGWVEKVFVDYVGEAVKKGQPLFTIYSPELVSTQEEYLLALRSKSELEKSSFDWIAKGSNDLAESARQRLALWGVSSGEIDEIEKTGKTRRALTVYSPVNGVVTQRAAYHHGTYVTPEQEIYTIVDLSTVWLLADVYEKDMPFIHAGQKVSIEFPYGDRRTMNATIDFFYPYLDPNTRTGQVRIQLSNPRSEFKPDQFVNVVIRTQEQEALTVPNDAVLNTGEKQYVFLDLGTGYFEPREVETGIQTPEGIAIEKGLKEGERVVTAANFLLDSEARLRGVLENMGKPSKQQTVQQGAAGNLQIQVLQPKTAKTGDNTFEVSVKDPSGNPVTGAEVEVSLFMPQMGNMPPMSSKGTLLDRGNGMYSGTVQIQMAWTWEATIVVRKSGKILGSTKINITAR